MNKMYFEIPLLIASIVLFALIILSSTIGLGRIVDYFKNKAISRILYKNVKIDFYYRRLSRAYIVKVYRGIFKSYSKKETLTIREVKILVKNIKAISLKYGIDSGVLIHAIESLDARGNLTVDEVANLVAAGIDTERIVEKARKQYTHNEILASRDLPAEWSDEVYGKKLTGYELSF